MRAFPAVALLLTLLATPSVAASGDRPDPLIPLATLLGTPQVTAPQLSPDGTQVCWIADAGGAPNLWVAPVDHVERARALTHEPGRGVTPFDVSGKPMVHWTADGARLVYAKDHDGDEQWNWWSVEVASGRAVNFTPRDHAQVRLLALGRDDARHALVGVNDRDPRRHDLYRADVATGELTLVERNERFVAYVADGTLAPRIAIAVTPLGELDVLRSAGDGRWEPLDHIGRGEAPGEAVGFDDTGTTFYARSTRGRDAAALVAWDVNAGTAATLATDPRVDVGPVLRDPATGRPQAYATNWTRTTWHALDPAIAPDLDALAKGCRGDFGVVTRSRDDRRWLVHVTRDDGPEAWLLYERPARTLKPLFVSHPALAKLPLAKLHPVVISSRDSLELVTYVTLPRWSDPDGDGVPDRPLPTVLLVHGGPSDERAQFGFAPFVQWLANRGYAVLWGNFRGSPGFGKAFLNAERLEWGGKMNLDLVDQANWAVAHGIADPKRIGIMGGSYGGYATLCALTLTPGVFACGVDVVGPANLETFITTMPPTWSYEHFVARVGDPRTPEGLAHVRARSPIHFVDRVRVPLLVAQGANDSRVPQAESDSLVAALDRRGARVTYLLFPDEGHGFQRPGNDAAFDAVTEAFFAVTLGGRCERLATQLDDSSVRVPVGAARVPGLAAALAHRDAKGTRR